MRLSLVPLLLSAPAPALAETISISGSPVSLGPSDDPAALAVVTFENVQMNGAHDNGDYTLAMADLVVGIRFAWEVGMFGQDRVEVLPPVGVVCVPSSCTAEVLEGFSGQVVLYPYEGF